VKLNKTINKKLFLMKIIYKLLTKSSLAKYYIFVKKKPRFLKEAGCCDEIKSGDAVLLPHAVARVVSSATRGTPGWKPVPLIFWQQARPWTERAFLLR
jgi:hypothetical protein